MTTAVPDVVLRGLPPLRGYITDRLIAYLEETLAAVEVAGEPRPILVGDGKAPTKGGWTKAGEPGRGDFRAYVTVATGPASPRDPDPLGSAHSSWILGYRLRAFGLDRVQADWAADQTRAAVVGLTHAVITAGDDTWKVSAVRYNQLGPVTPFRGQLDPPPWQVSDDVGLWVDRQRRARS